MAIQTMAILISVMVIWVAVGEVDSAHHAPTPAVDCSGLFLDMADCLTYVTNGSTTSKPEGSCCSGLKTVLKTDAECLCEAFKSSAQFGVVLNITKAATLPSACHVSAPPLSDCGLSIAIGAAPEISPSGALPPSAAAGGPTSVSGGGSAAAAPVPVPGGSGSSASLAISIGSLVIVLLVSSFYFF